MKQENLYVDILNGTSPKTGKYFAMSHHHSEEVATDTLKSIKRTAGLE